MGGQAVAQYIYRGADHVHDGVDGQPGPPGRDGKPGIAIYLPSPDEDGCEPPFVPKSPTQDAVSFHFYIDETRLFALDVASRTVIAEGRPRRFDPAEIEVHQDDVYVDAALLSEWLPLHLAVDLHGSTITVRPAERLPSQLRLDRESQLESSRAGQRLAAPAYPKIELPYRLFDGPFVDQTLGFTRQANPQAGRQNSLLSTTYATGDVLFMAANASNCVASCPVGKWNSSASV